MARTASASTSKSKSKPSTPATTGAGEDLAGADKGTENDPKTGENDGLDTNEDDPTKASKTTDDDNLVADDDPSKKDATTDVGLPFDLNESELLVKSCQSLSLPFLSN